MKKMLALLTALLLVLGCCPAYAGSGHDKADYVGYWEVEMLVLMGVEYPAESLGLNGFMSFREDGTVVLSATGEGFQGSVATYANGGCTIDSNNGSIPVVIDENGRLRWESTMNGIDVSMICVRSQAPAMSAEAAALVGVWEMTSLVLDGASYSDVSGLGRYVVTVYDDGYGVIEAPSSSVLFRIDMVDGVLKGLDGEGVYFPLGVENGQLHVQMASAEHELVLIADRVGGAPLAEEPAATWDSDSPLGSFLNGTSAPAEEEPAVEEPAATWDSDSPLSSFLNGASAPVEEEPAVEEPAATWDSDSPLSSFLNGASAPAVEEPAVEEPAATWDSDSPLSSFLNGASAPVEEEPAVEEPAATWDSDSPLSSFLNGASAPVEEEPAATSLDGTWQVLYVEKDGTIIPAEQAGVTGTLTVTGESGRWTYGSASSLGILTQNASGVRLTTRAGEFMFSLNEQGYLCLNDGDAVLWLSRGDLAEPIIEEPVTEAPATGGLGGDNALSAFLNGGSTPMVEEPVIEEPVTEAPATGGQGGDNALSAFLNGGSTPATSSSQESAAVSGATAVSGYEGRWRTVSISAMGMTFTAEELSASGYEVQFNGASADFIIDGTTVISGSLVVTDKGVQITDGLTFMPCSFNANGQLVVVKLESGVTMELIMERVDK
ncbi:MAG: hypothetical protein IKK57_06670 [Clostridia bacterium]|nr:hypothetical protein [Clostridia bacterium]